MVGGATYNKRKINFNLEKKKKARVKRKALKLSEKHKHEKANLVSGKRTKKSQRKMLHRAKMAEQARLALGDEVMADVPQQKTRKRKVKKSKGTVPAAAGANTAATADEVMQE